MLSDKKHIAQGYSKLTVVVDDSSNFYLDKVLVKNDSTEFKLSKDYDTIRKTLVYVYDSLRNNEYEITLASLLNRSFKIPLTLIEDTVIFINKSQLQNFDTLTNANNLLSDLQYTDTICIAYASMGCFHNYSNKTLIYKRGDNFIAEFTIDTSHDSRTQQIILIKRQLAASFSDTLKNLESGCIEGLSKQQEIKKYCDKELSKAKNAMDSMRATIWLYSSTTSSAIYLNKRNKVFALTNNGINEIPYYHRFMNALKLE
jgi:hypothetical protein